MSAFLRFNSASARWIASAARRFAEAIYRAALASGIMRHPARVRRKRWFIPRAPLPCVLLARVTVARRKSLTSPGDDQDLQHWLARVECACLAAGDLKTTNEIVGHHSVRSSVGTATSTVSVVSV
jgi:hypothetical protein